MGLFKRIMRGIIASSEQSNPTNQRTPQAFPKHHVSLSQGQIFGYDITRADHPVPKPSSEPRIGRTRGIAYLAGVPKGVSSAVLLPRSLIVMRLLKMASCNGWTRIQFSLGLYVVFAASAGISLCRSCRCKECSCFWVHRIRRDDGKHRLRSSSP